MGHADDLHPPVFIIDVVLDAVVAHVRAMQPFQPAVQPVADAMRVRQKAAVDDVDDRPC